MVACSCQRKGPRFGRRAGLPRWLGRAPQRTRPLLDRIEQRPVAVREHVALGERRAQLEPERAQHPVVAIVALQDDADEGCGGSAAGAAATNLVSRPSVVRISVWMTGSSAPGTLYSSLAGTIIAAMVRRSLHWARVS
jgi:hypothetical protein